VTVRSERRRRWAVEDKLAIVRETLGPDAVVKVVQRQRSWPVSDTGGWPVGSAERRI